MSDVIKDARQLLDGATPGPWEHYNDHGIVSLASGDMPIATDLNAWDADLIAAAPEHAETIAGMEWEYQCQRLLPGTPQDWYTWLTTYSLESAKIHTEKHVEKLRARGYEPPSYRIRRRLVGDWEVINE